MRIEKVNGVQVADLVDAGLVVKERAVIWSTLSALVPAIDAGLVATGSRKPAATGAELTRQPRSRQTPGSPPSPRSGTARSSPPSPPATAPPARRRPTGYGWIGRSCPPWALSGRERSRSNGWTGR
jgi:hypothetical protein